MFECSDPGSIKSFHTFSELKSHLDIGHHCVKERQFETHYDMLRRDWVDILTTSGNITRDATRTPGYQRSVTASSRLDQSVSMD